MLGIQFREPVGGGLGKGLEADPAETIGCHFPKKQPRQDHGELMKQAKMIEALVTSDRQCAR